MSIENRNLTKGMKLTGRYHKQTYSCEVVEDAERKLHYHLEDGREFKSPSAAGMAITGHSCDGWKFWSMRRRECSCSVLRRNNRLHATEANQTAEPSSNLHRMPPRPTPRKPEYFWCRIRRACRKDRFAGSAGTAARASSPRPSKCRGYARTTKPAETA